MSTRSRNLHADRWLHIHPIVLIWAPGAFRPADSEPCVLTEDEESTANAAVEPNLTVE
jgi:hypothetical protein